jgi:signal transduction histidine kinase
MRLGLRGKLVVSYICVGASALLLSIFANRYVQSQAERAVAGRVELLRRTADLSSVASSASEEGFSYVVSGDDEERRHATEKLQLLVTKAHDLPRLDTLSTEEILLVARVDDAAVRMRRAEENMFEGYDLSGLVPHDNYEAYEVTIDALVDTIAVLEIAERAQATERTAIALRRSTRLTIGIGLVALLLAVAAGSAIGRRVTGPLLALRDAAGKFGEGDLSIEIPRGANDEIGDLSRAFEKMVQDTRRYIETIVRANTEQLRIETELRQAQKLEAVGRLASGVAHEINTPVQFLSDNLYFLRDACADLLVIIGKYGDAARAHPADAPRMLAEAAPEEAKRDLAYVVENVPGALAGSIDGVGRIATIVRAMKEFAHPDGPERIAADLNKLVESTLVIARNEYKYVADVVTDLGTLPRVECVPGEFNQAFLNLVVNASHAIDDVVRGGPERGTITVRTRLEGSSVVVSVTDTGCGIPEEIRQRIFDPFFTTKEVGRGTGQGLAVVHAVVVTKLKGRIQVDSEVGRGTTFELYIPVAPTSLAVNEAA